jgi:hypothetical protein
MTVRVVLLNHVECRKSGSADFTHMRLGGGGVDIDSVAVQLLPEDRHSAFSFRANDGLICKVNLLHMSSEGPRLAKAPGALVAGVGRRVQTLQILQFIPRRLPNFQNFRLGSVNSFLMNHRRPPLFKIFGADPAAETEAGVLMPKVISKGWQI